MQSITQTTPSDRTQITLRPYQQQCIQAIKTTEAKGIKRQLVALPTGTGKTIIFGTLAKTRNGRTLIKAHRDELIEQAVEKLQLVWPGADVGVVKAQRNEIDHQVVVASVQTLSRESRLEQFPKDFDLVITDEAHHSVASTYQRVYQHLGIQDATDSQTLHLGVTATPNRADDVGLQQVFDKIVYEKNILDMIRAGYLCDMRCEQIRTEIDVSQVTRSHGDYSIEGLAPLINTTNGKQLIVDRWLSDAKHRLTLAFTVDVQHAKDLAQTFRNAGIEAEAVWGNMPLDKRRAILLDFAAGNIQVITNCGVLTEGYDNPRLDCLILARPTKSTGLYTQMIGRGTRIHPEKSDCLILDVACISDKHDLISLPDLFGLKALPDSSTTVIEQFDKESIGSKALPIAGYGYHTKSQEVDLFAASRLVWVTTERGYELNLGRDGRIFVHTAVEAPNKYRVFYHEGQNRTQVTPGPVDISSALGFAESHARRVTNGNPIIADKQASWRKHPATPRQLAALTRMGIEFHANLTKGEASDLIGSCIRQVA